MTMSFVKFDFIIIIIIWSHVSVQQ